MNNIKINQDTENDSIIDKSNPVEITEAEWKALNYDIAFPKEIEENGIKKVFKKVQWYKQQDGALMWDVIYEIEK